MSLDLTVCVGEQNRQLIKLVDSRHSESSSRDIVNKNFQNLAKAIACLTQFSISDLEGLVLPEPAIAGVFYNLIWTGTTWSVQESPSNYGTKYRLDPQDNLTIKSGYQYIVHNNLVLNGGSITLEADAELVIL